MPGARRDHMPLLLLVEGTQRYPQQGAGHRAFPGCWAQGCQGQPCTPGFCTALALTEVRSTHNCSGGRCKQKLRLPASILKQFLTSSVRSLIMFKNHWKKGRQLDFAAWFFPCLYFAHSSRLYPVNFIISTPQEEEMKDGGLHTWKKVVLGSASPRPEHVHKRRPQTLHEGVK